MSEEKKVVRRSEKVLRGAARLGLPVVGVVGLFVLVACVMGLIFHALNEGRIDFGMAVCLHVVVMSVLQVIWVGASV